MKHFIACPEHFREGDLFVDLPSGFFNFIESMTELDAYTYSVFPKNDVLGMLTDSAIGADGRAGGGGLGLFRRLVSSRTEPVSIGYGGGRGMLAGGEPDGDGIRFGWVISAPAEMQPSLRTQLALVSVPAWTDRLTIHVSTGWLDRAGRRYQVQALAPMPIRLPPDVGALDSIFRNQGWVSPAPRIQDEAMDQAIYVVAGQDASILIPGARLWRSTSVTLGAQQADRIRVLPNMEGIIAEFRPVQLPFAKYNPRPASETDPKSVVCSLDERAARSAVAGATQGKADPFSDLEVRPVRLRVWTSEGVADAARHACVMYDPAGQIRARMAPTAPQAKAAADGSSADGAASDVAAAVAD
jgi:hypothetical protein